MGYYEEVFKYSIENPEQFWAEAAEEIFWFRKWDQTLAMKDPYLYQWFAGGQVNICYNAVDRHVELGRGDQTAIIFDSPNTGTTESITYSELLSQVSRFGGSLKELGVQHGDRVIIYMPTIPQALIAMLACARIGAVHTVVFGGFGPQELASRIDDARPRALLTASFGIQGETILPYKPIVDKAIDLAHHKPEFCVVFERPQTKAELQPGRDFDWDQLIAKGKPTECIPVQATDPLYILYTSALTGMPKGVVRDTGGYAVALRWSMRNIYDAHPGDVFWTASSIGSSIGHSYMAYAPLITGCTTIVYEAIPVGLPDPCDYWRVLSKYGVKVLLAAPTALRAIRKEDPDGELLKAHDISRLKYVFVASERLDLGTHYWARELLQRPLVEQWEQAETGWPVASNCLGIEQLPTKPGSVTKPVPGFDVKTLNSAGRSTGSKAEGIVAIKTPLPPGTLAALWQSSEKLVDSHYKMFPGYYATADSGCFDEDGYLFITGRVDDAINVAGYRLSTGGMEAAIGSHPTVAECAVIGVFDDLSGQVPIGLVVLKPGVTQDPEEIKKEIADTVREQVGIVANYRDTVIIKRLPRTRSGKILRSVIRKIADGREYHTPFTIDDPAVLLEIQEALQHLVHGKQ